jgi:hypothetical protein
MAKLTYSRAAFDVPDEAAARRIILTPEFGQDTDERWERETPYLAQLIGASCSSPQTRSASTTAAVSADFPRP